MAAIAIGVVLLPDAGTHRQIVELNADLQGERGQLYVFGDDLVPHLTVTFGAIQQGSLGEILSFLVQASDTMYPFELTMKSIKVMDDSVYTCIDLEPTERLAHLHGACVTCVEQYHATNVEAEMFAHNSPEQLEVAWTANFFKTSARESYWPHLSIGYGGLSKVPTGPAVLRFDRLAVYQLGKYCSAAKELWSAGL